MATIGNFSVTVTFDGTTTPPTFTFTGSTVAPGNIIKFTSPSDQAVVITLTLVSEQTVIFPTLADNGQNAIVWGGPYVQTGWTRVGPNTLVLTALEGQGEFFSYLFTLYVYDTTTDQFSSTDPSIANADIPPVVEGAGAPATQSVARAA